MNKKTNNKKIKTSKYEPLLDELKEQDGFELSEDDIDDWLTCILDDRKVEYREYGLQTISYSKFIHGYLYEYTMDEIEKDCWEYNLKIIMNKTLEQLIEDNIDVDYPHTLEKYTVLALLKQVRQATLIEAANAVYTKTESMYTGGLNGNGLLYEDEIVIDRDSILNLDLNTIEL